MQVFPSNLYESLPPTSLGCNNPFSLKQFNLINGNLEPIVLIKQEKDHDGLEIEPENNDYSDAIDMLETDDIFQEKFSHSNALDNSYDLKVFNVSEENVDQQEKTQPFMEFADIDLKKDVRKKVLIH